MKRALTSTIAIVAAVILATASPAGASGPYDWTWDSTSGNAGSNNASWTASADMTSAGEFDISASLNDPGMTFDSNMAWSAGFAHAENWFTLDPGEYIATIAYSGVTITLSSTHVSNGSAGLGLSSSGDIEWLETGGGVHQSMLGGVVTPSGSITNASGSMWVRFRVSATDTYGLGTTANAQVHSGTSVAQVHGGAASAAIVGQIDSITVAPA